MLPGNLCGGDSRQPILATWLPRTMAVRTCRVSIMTVLAHRAEFPTNDRYTWRRKFWPPSTEEGAWSSVGTVSSLPVLHAGTDVLKRSPQAWARSSSIRTIGFLWILLHIAPRFMKWFGKGWVDRRSP